MLSRIVACAASWLAWAALAGPAPLPQPDLATFDFRKEGAAVALDKVSVIGVTVAGAAIVAGPFDAVNGLSRPFGVARVGPDGSLDAGWAPQLTLTQVPTSAVGNAQGAVALLHILEASVPLPPPSGKQRISLISAQGAVATLPDSFPVHAMALAESGHLYRYAMESYGEGRVLRFAPDGAQDTGFDLKITGSYVQCFFFFPQPTVSVLLPDGPRLYVGGNFTVATGPQGAVNIGGALRVDAQTGFIDTTWAPMNATVQAASATVEGEKATCGPEPPSGAVAAMVLGPADTIYLGGGFQRQSRAGLGRFSTTGSGAVDPGWVPSLRYGAPIALHLDGARQRLLVSESQPQEWERAGTYALSSVDASVDTRWDPADDGSVTAMRVVGTRLVMGGTFTKVSGVARHKLAALPLDDNSAAPVLRLTPAVLDFGKAPHGETRTLDATVTNSGNAPLTVGEITFTGPGFTQTNDCAAPILASAQCTVHITWTSDGVTPIFNSAINIAGPAGTTPQSTELRTAVAYAQPRIALGNGSWVTAVGTTRTRSGVLANTGDTALLMTGIVVAPPSVGDIRLSATADCPQVLPVGASCPVTVVFQPVSVGTYSPWLQVTAQVGNLPPYGGQATDSLYVQSVAADGDFDGDGIPNAMESTEGTDLTRRDNRIFSSSRLFVLQQYRDFLGREGDTQGVDYWRGRLDAATITRSAVVRSFFAADEFQGRVAPVVRLYFSYFLRTPDYAGLQFWMGRFAAGDSLDTISSAFAGSAEFAQRYGNLDNAAFVDRVYGNVLGRLADEDGRRYWIGQLDSGALTRGQVMTRFSEAAEFRAVSFPEVFVTMAYVGMLRRAPEPAGFSSWVRYLDEGGSVDAVIDQFVASLEYRNRFLDPSLQ